MKRLCHGLVVAMLCVGSAHATKLQVCIGGSGQIAAKPKCKAGETPLNVGELARRIQSPATPAALTEADVNRLVEAYVSGKLLTPADVSGLIAAYASGKLFTRADVNELIAGYVACDKRNTAGQAAHDALKAAQADIQGYGIVLNGIGMKGIFADSNVTQDTLSAAQVAFDDAVADVRAGNFPRLLNIRGLAVKYISQAVAWYASSSPFWTIRQHVRTALYSLATMDIGEFQSEACGQ